MLVKIGGKWVNPEKVVAVTPHIADSGWAWVIFTPGTADIAVHSTPDEVAEAVNNALAQ